MQLSIAELDLFKTFLTSHTGVDCSGVDKPALLLKLMHEREHLINAHKSEGDCTLLLRAPAHLKVNIIKFYRALTGAGLRETHDLVMKHSTQGGTTLRVDIPLWDYDRVMLMQKKFPEINIEMVSKEQ